MKDKRIAGVFESTLPDQRETLAGRSAENNGDILVAYTGAASDIHASDVFDVATDHGATGKIELMRCTMDRVDLDCRSDIEAGPLETEAQASCSGKQIDPDRSHSPPNLRIKLQVSVVILPKSGPDVDRGRTHPAFEKGVKTGKERIDVFDFALPNDHRLPAECLELGKFL